MDIDVSLCIINRDDSENLSRLIRSARPCFKEIIVVDTDSADDSVFLAKQAGADIVDEMPELIIDGDITSFSRARQRSYDLSTCSWQMWLDTDDDLSDWNMLPDVFRLAGEKRDEKGPGFYVRLWYDYSWNDDRSTCTQKICRERLTHRDDGWTWKSPVHEFLNRPDLSNNIVLEIPRVVHLSRGARGSKNDRNLKILRKWQADGYEPRDANRLFYYLGDEMFHRRMFMEAFEYLNRVSDGDDVFTLSARVMSVRSLYECRKYEAARQLLDHLVERYPNISNFRSDQARVYLSLGLRKLAWRSLEACEGQDMKSVEDDRELIKTLKEIMGIVG